MNETSTRTEIRAARLRPPLRRGAILAVVLAVAFVAWLLLKDDDKSSSSKSPNAGSEAAAVAASPADLAQISREVGHPVYWVGPRAGYTYELTKTESGNVYIRYLPEGVDVGDTRPDFLVVGTYPLQGAYAGVKKEGTREGAVTKKLPDNGLAVANANRRRSVYFAYPDSGLQIEVYDRSPQVARDLVFQGKIRPVR
jgi:hypothetical protein